MLYGVKNPHGGDRYGDGIALDFSANVSPLGTPKCVTEAIERSLPELYRYPDPYCRALVQAIARYEGVPGEFILCGNGASELIYAYCEAVRPGRAMELAPTFSEYSLALQRRGCGVVRFALSQEEKFDLQERFLARLAREKIDALFLCNPNNPTGRLIAGGLLEKILRVCRENNIALFVDECFLSLSDGGTDLTPFLREFPQLFVLKAFTKSFGMAGLRLGYGLSADGALLRKMSAAVPPWNVSALAQAAGVAALGDAEFLERNRAVIRARRRGSKNGCGSLASGCVRRRRITFCFAVRRAWRIGCASAALRSATVRILRAWGRDGIARLCGCGKKMMRCWMRCGG